MNLDNKIIVWDLFGGTQNSIYNAMKYDDRFEIITIDITEPTRLSHFKINLMNYRSVAINLLRQLPKPDIIVGSPPCDSFSSILSMKGGGTPIWIPNQYNFLDVRSKENFESLKGGFTKNIVYENQFTKAAIGSTLLLNLINIIEEFKPKYWYIENPANSLLWKYLSNNMNWKKGIVNKCKYGLYGFPTMKRTIFLSNINLNLKNGKWENKAVNFVEGSTWKRGENHFYNNCKKKMHDSSDDNVNKSSEIPEPLIKDIFNSFDSERERERERAKREKLAFYYMEQKNRSKIPEELIIEIMEKFKDEN